VLVKDARAVASAWVAEHAARCTGFRGAFFAGSTMALAEDSDLPRSSDVDVVVVVSGEKAAPKLGKLLYRGALLEITYLPWDRLADVDEVATSYYLAPSFSSNQVIADPTGRLAILRDEISSRFDDPAAIRLRYEDVISRIQARLSALDPAAAWHDQVTTWMFPTSLTTQVVLVAAGEIPTVRRRYVAARRVLEDHGNASLYRTLLDLLGCADRDRDTVQRHLDRLVLVFDQAEVVATTPFFFSTDITRAARPIAIDGSQDLIDHGLHREAVFWIIATFARCQTILAADASTDVRRNGELRFRACVAELLGIRDTAELFDRNAAVLRLLPTLRRSAASIATGTAH